MKAVPFPQANKVLKAPPGQEQDVYDLPVWGGEPPEPSTARESDPNAHRWLVVICREGAPELTRFEAGTVDRARNAASHEVDTLLAIIDRLTGKRFEGAGRMLSMDQPIDTSEAEEAARHFEELWPRPYRPGGELDEP